MRICFVAILSSAVFLLIFACGEAKAAFIISSAIVEFTAEGPRQQDIDLISRSADNDYIVCDVNEMINPDTPQESRRPVEDPTESRLLVTPDKTILAANNRQVLRFVLLRPPDDKEHIYRVGVKPVIRGIEHQSLIGLKVLIGYEVLIIIRPAHIASDYSAARHGKSLVVTNNGNTNILFQGGLQCSANDACPPLPAKRIYPGQKATISLPLDRPVTYSVWDGKTNVEKVFE